MNARERERAAHDYLGGHEGKPPHQLRRSYRSERARAAILLGDGGGVFPRLQMLEPDKALRYFVIAVRDLGLSVALEHEKSLWSHESVQIIKKAVCQVAPAAFYARLEAGRREKKVHIHFVAHQAPSCASRESKESRDNDLRKLATYLCKPPAPSDDESIGFYLEGRENARKAGKKRLPRLSFWQGIGRG